MKTYLVGYDLNRPVQNYTKLIDALKAYSNWWHHLDSTWLIKTNNSAEQIRNHLRQFIDANDELLVAYVAGESAWAGFNNEGSTWLNDYIVSN
jgi:hypothetical protein